VCNEPRPSHFPQIHELNNVWRGYKSWSSSWNSVQPPVALAEALICLLLHNRRVTLNPQQAVMRWKSSSCACLELLRPT
jgi:hypothetical protein